MPGRKRTDESTKNRRRALSKTIILLLLAFLVFIFATIAWFVMSRSNTAGGMSVKAADLPFELEVRGTYIENADIMTVNSLFTDEFKNGIQQTDGEGTLINIFRTGANNEKIVWRKNSQSGSDPLGLSPGSSGELAFWVIPNQTGVLNLHFDMNIRGYHAVYEGDTMTELIEITDSLVDSSANAAKGIISADAKKEALKYINSHILFFRSYDSTTGLYSDFCGMDSIDFNDYISGNDKTVIKDQAYPVTIYWIWVNDIGDMFLQSTSQYASSPLFDDSDDDDREASFDYLEELKSNVFAGMTESAITNALTDVQDSSSVTFRDSLTALTNGYDNADLDIGNNINYILIEMTAEAV